VGGVWGGEKKTVGCGRLCDNRGGWEVLSVKTSTTNVSRPRGKKGRTQKVPEVEKGEKKEPDVSNSIEEKKTVSGWCW